VAYAPLGHPALKHLTGHALFPGPVRPKCAKLSRFVDARGGLSKLGKCWAVGNKEDSKTRRNAGVGTHTEGARGWPWYYWISAIVKMDRREIY
jgi:hypothetical protein